ncbi:MAG: hypothetical protein U0169_15705 [Polyangiaceae bacterium]
MLGTLAFARRNARLSSALLIGLAGQALVNGAAWDWWAGGSFGGRRFDSCFVVFAIGGAEWVALSASLVSGKFVARWSLAERWCVRGLVGAAWAGACLVAFANLELASSTSAVSARIAGGEPASLVWRQKVPGVGGRLASWLSLVSNFPARAVFAWRNDVGLRAYDRVVGVHVLGETYPGLNPGPDRFRDDVPVDAGEPVDLGLHALGTGRARMSGATARIFVGLNRQGSVRLRVPVETTGRVELRWNGTRVLSDDVVGKRDLEVDVPEVRRGVNTLSIAAPAGAVVSTIAIRAGSPGHADPDRRDF